MMDLLLSREEVERVFVVATVNRKRGCLADDGLLERSGWVRSGTGVFRLKC